MFSCTWFCSRCGREFCNDCQIKLSELCSNSSGNFQESPSLEETDKSISNRGRSRDFNNLLRCFHQQDHDSKDFLPVSRFHCERVSSTIDEMKRLLSSAGDLAESPSYPVNPAPEVIPPAQIYPSHSTIIIKAGEFTSDYFTQIWKLHRPIVVDRLQLDAAYLWSPEYLMELYGDDICPIENCQTGEQRLSSVREFFGMYGKERGEPWKLKVCSIARLPRP